MKDRIANCKRTTRETDIDITLNIDGRGKTQIDSGIGFFDHMLDGMSRHGFLDLNLKCKGDLQVDGHHTVEDCGIVLGTAIKEAVGDKAGIRRYGHFILPMDESLVVCAVDLSGRPYLQYDLFFQGERLGGLDTQLIKEFFYAVSVSGAMNLHLKMLTGGNDHHVAEAAFKAFGKALDMATSFDERLEGAVASTKGSL